MIRRRCPPQRLALLATSVCATLGACATGAHHAAPEVVYPVGAWAAGIEGDVVVEICAEPSTPHVVSGRPELNAAALQMAEGAWTRPPRLEGTSLENCRQTTFAFRKSPTPAEAATLSVAKDTVFVTRGLKPAKPLRCRLFPENPQGAFVEGVTDADVTVDDAGHVTNVVLLRSVGSEREAAMVSSMKDCAFLPATVDGKPFLSHFKWKIRWTME